MRKIILILSLLMLAACVGNPPREAEIASYDLGSFSGTWTSPGFPIATVDVKASTWLDSPAQLYRLAYADDLRRRAYTQSRWAAPPAELLEHALLMPVPARGTAKISIFNNSDRGCLRAQG